MIPKMTARVARLMFQSFVWLQGCCLLGCSGALLGHSLAIVVFWVDVMGLLGDC